MDSTWREFRSHYSDFKIVAIKKRKRTTCRIIQLQEDWKLRRHSNIFHLLWTYLIKDDKTKAARCVCNGSPHMTGSVSLEETYAGSIDQVPSKLFWIAMAINKSITVGVDIANAFTDAGAPKAPLFITVDQPFREW